MHKNIKHFLNVNVILSVSLFMAEVFCEEDKTTTKQDSRGTLLDDVVVTAVANPLSSLRFAGASSVLYPEQIKQSVPGNAADILRNMPGILSQASGGEGNANVSVRGMKHTGGARFTLFQEDGLPIVEFGDIDFGTADTFLRSDYNIDRVEVVRGGPASTFASNAPFGVFNFISKTGETTGGNAGLTHGIDFNRTRLDFNYGQRINADWRYHIGGLFRIGEGSKTINYKAESGGQLKGNVTRELGNGFLRLNFKLLNDRAPVYLPVPVSITGTNSDPSVSSLAGFDVRHGAMQSKYFLHDLAVNKDGATISTDIADGYYSDVKTIGGEAMFKFSGDWKINNKFRYSAIDGRFVGPYPAEVDTAANLATSIGSAGASLRYATGPQAGQIITNPGTLNGNGLAVRTHLFNVTLEDLSHIANDLKLTKNFDNTRFGSTEVTLGYYKSRQYIVEDWHWNTYLQEVKGEDAVLLDVYNAANNPVTQNGLVAYGEPFWGNCCVRYYDLYYDTDAPYFALNWEKGPYNFDGSLRYDIAGANGIYADNNGTQVLDVNGDGVIQVPEQTVPVVDLSAAMPVDYTVSYLSWSVGGNYLLRPDLALFARVSEGGRANAERLLFGGGIRTDGSISDEVAVNTVRQYEGGVKWRRDNAALYLTLFHADTTIVNQDITAVTNRFTNQTFEATGAEFESELYWHNFSAHAGLTYTDSEIVEDQNTPANVGLPTAADFIYQFSVDYNTPKFLAGVNVIGTTDAPFGQQGLIAPGFTQVNAYTSYEPINGVKLSLSANNLFNTIGITEIPDATLGVSANGLNRARSIEGRTIGVLLEVSF